MDRESEANRLKIRVLSNPLITDVVVKLFLCSEFFECEVSEGCSLIEEVRAVR